MSEDWESLISGVLYFIIGVGCVVVVAANQLGYIQLGGNGIEINPPAVTGAESSAASKWDTQASKVVEAMDYKNPTTRDYAVSLIDQKHGGEYNIAQICDMWEKIFNKWTYVNDPSGSEYYSPASRTIANGLKGDCDDFAILMASVIMATGGSARIISAKNTDEPGHTYTEVYLGSSKSSLQNTADYICLRYRCKSIAYRTLDVEGQTRYYLNLDWQAKHPGGPYYQNDGETVAIYENGYWARLK